MKDCGEYQKTVKKEDLPIKQQHWCIECNSLSWQEHLLRDGETYYCPFCSAEVELLPF